ncbi:MAG: DinB family protein [Candidatus Heimdallarchaeota archaeon]|nr:MAG: DinB family protein [Candidatus Heimdallarchaeota archaeon]
MDLKTFAIETFEIAEWNVLKAIFRLKPKDFEKQLTPNLNPIRWIIGHLTIHMDTIFNQLCLGERKLDQDFRDYFTMGPDRANHREFPLSYMELIDKFLEFSKSSFDYLYHLPEKKFLELPEYNIGNNSETVAELIQRISLHFLGHTGQIYQIKRELGKGGTFVMGVKKKNRNDSRNKWLNWWKTNKNHYQ